MPVIHTPAELDAAFDEGRPHFRELRAETKDGAALYALVSGDVGWLMYLRVEGDAGFSSRNSNYVGPADAVIQYRLDNGQVDEYPAAWALPAGELKRAMEHFLRAGEPAPWIVWHNDSGDGVVIGRTA
jgi:hypothetical protein